MMRALIYKEFILMRSFLLQVTGAIVLCVLLFGSSLEGFLLSYLTILPIVMSLTFPQLLFSLEDRGNTLIFLRSLPVRPRQIVAAKYIVSILLIGAMLLLAFGYAWSVGKLASVLPNAGYLLVISAALLSLSLFMHFRLGSASAKVGLLISLLLFSLLGMTLMKSPGIVAAIQAMPLVKMLTAYSGTWLGVALGLLLGALALFISFVAASAVFTRQDVSRIP